LHWGRDGLKAKAIVYEVADRSLGRLAFVGSGSRD
jgi:hypothetical protein